MIRYYKNSLLASIVSIFGCSMILAGIVIFAEGEPSGGAAIVVFGFVMALWGKRISNNKAFKQWWKQIQEQNLEPVIAKDLNTAIAIYQKHPKPETLNKIAALNPTFAQYIRENIANKK